MSKKQVYMLAKKLMDAEEKTYKIARSNIDELDKLVDSFLGDAIVIEAFSNKTIGDSELQIRKKFLEFLKSTVEISTRQHKDLSKSHIDALNDYKSVITEISED